MAITSGRQHVYDSLKKKMGKKKAAKIANAGKTKVGRVKMAKRAAATRKKRRSR